MVKDCERKSIIVLFQIAALDGRPGMGGSNAVWELELAQVLYVLSFVLLLARSPTIHRGLECASVFELVSVCLIVCL